MLKTETLGLDLSFLEVVFRVCWSAWRGEVKNRPTSIVESGAGKYARCWVVFPGALERYGLAAVRVALQAEASSEPVTKLSPGEGRERWR